jgi:hypothetical protein
MAQTYKAIPQGSLYNIPEALPQGSLYSYSQISNISRQSMKIPRFLLIMVKVMYGQAKN